MSPKRVTLVALVAGGHGGVPRYAQMLVRALGDLGTAADAIELSVLTTDRGAGIIGTLPIEVRTVPLRSPRLNRGPIRVATEQLATRHAPSDLLHFFDMTGPLLASKHPFVATIHDVSVIHNYSVVRQAYKRWLYPWAARRARAVVAISEFAKGEAVTHLGADPSRVHVVHSGPGLVSTAATDTETPPDAAPYFLFVGNLTASKNLPFLVRAFEEADVDARLVLAGRPAEHFGELREAIENSSRRDRIEVLENVSDDHLDSLYRHAVALVLPSRYEGFALTPLEAMARGCPVLASDIPAVREISGDGAWLLPVDDNPSWAQALRTVLTDGGMREALKRRGTMRSEGYSWERTAQGVYAVFLDALGVSP